MPGSSGERRVFRHSYHPALGSDGKIVRGSGRNGSSLRRGHAVRGSGESSVVARRSAFDQVTDVDDQLRSQQAEHSTPTR